MLSTNIESRIIYKNINDNIKTGNVLYKVSREFRTQDNYALYFAYKLALENKSKLYVIYTHENKEWDMVSRTRDFMLDGLEELSHNLHALNIPFEYLETNKTSHALEKYIKDKNINTIVTGYTPMRENFIWIKNLLKIIEVNIYVLDAHNIIPVSMLSDKEEFAASTIRKKIYNKISFYHKEYVEQNLEITKYKYNDLEEVKEIYNKNNWEKIRKNFKVSAESKPYKHKGGEKEAKKIFVDFVHNKLSNYDEDRNNANMDGQSNLSPFINFGMISKAYMLNYILDYYKLELGDVFDENKNGSGNKVFDNKNVRAFLEELIVRGELSENYCYYNINFNNFDGLREWAKASLTKASTDKREYIYNLKEFESGETHDELWNASMNELRGVGKMHGYMRMYWAKKILEWTGSPEEAIKIAIYLNDKYSIDGYAANGYAGTMWSIGGLHDRAWFGWPVFGLIRYMARSGCEKRFDVEDYISKHKI